MSEVVVENARIESATIEMERGLLTSWVHLRMNGSGQGFGGYNLGHPDDTSRGTFLHVWIAGVMRALGVERWSDVPGQIVRVRRDDGRVYAIGHAIEGRWFEPDAVFAAQKRAESALPAVP